MEKLTSDSGDRQEDEVAANKPNQWYLAIDGDLLPAPFRSHSLLITNDLVQYICGHTDAPAPCKSAMIMRHVVDDILMDRLSSMRQLAEKLDIQRPDDIALLNCVATAMFDDDIVTWGRIVTLFAYAGYLARYCHEQGLSECSETVAELLQSIVVNRLGLWILAHGGWVSCISCYFVIMAALCNRAGHYILFLSFILCIFLFSSPNLSRCRLDVYYTSMHGVALLRI